MSGVHLRDRKTTDVQYIVTARELRIELTKFLRNQKNIPKSDRYLIAMPIIEKARELSLSCTAANAVFPVDERTLAKRKDYLIAAWVAAQQLQEDLIVCIETVQTANVAKLSAVIERLGNLCAMIKAAKKSAKIITRKADC
ncbi:MAG: hypothetical protein J5781_00095 [Clostridia bacterium]|nr:hypothetical protein [Clostridia bacterium]